MSALDSAIGLFNKALARDARKPGTKYWAGRLQKVTDGQNSVPNEEYLEGSAPQNVEGDDNLMFNLYKQNAKFLAMHQRNMMQRASKLEEAGSFRATDGSNTRFTRGWKPAYGSTARQVKYVRGALVTDTSGNNYLTKCVLPVDN